MTGYNGSSRGWSDISGHAPLWQVDPSELRRPPSTESSTLHGKIDGEAVCLVLQRSLRTSRFTRARQEIQYYRWLKQDSGFGL
jgi:hypothetical protein